MKYKKNQYTEGFSICALIIAGMFYYWGIDAFWNGFWSFNINWMGFLWIGIGTAILVSQIAALMNRSKLRSVVLYEFQQNPNAAMEEISNNTGISIRDLRAIILDLKASGRLRGNFSPETGSAKEMLNFAQVVVLQSSVLKPLFAHIAGINYNFLSYFF